MTEPGGSVNRLCIPGVEPERNRIGMASQFTGDFQRTFSPCDFDADSESFFVPGKLDPRKISLLVQFTQRGKEAFFGQVE